MTKKISLIILLLLIALGKTTAQNRYDMHVGFGGGAALPISRFHRTHEVGFLGYADVNIFARTNLAAGVRYSYNYFLVNAKNADIRENKQLHEVILNGTFYFKGSWRFFLGFGLGCYLEPTSYNDLGFVPSIGVMHQFAKKWFLHIRGDFAYMRKNDFSHCKLTVGVSLPFYSAKEETKNAPRKYHKN